jgi:monoamine oxidase
MTLDHDTLAEAVHGELQALLGSLPPPEWHQVIVEKRATFACTPNLQRPAVATPHPRIFLAGDYTAGDYPATLEGAVRSGVQCAQTLMTTLQ